jgi:hypothetical protein
MRLFGRAAKRTLARRVGLTAALFALLATTNSAELVPFDPADQGQLFGVRSEVVTAGAPSGVTFINGTLYVSDSEVGVVIAHHADGTKTTLLAGQAADESSPVFGLVPNMLSSAQVRIFENNTHVDTSVLLISDSSVSRVIAIGVAGAYEGEHLFTMALDWPDGHADVDDQVAVINGMAMAPGSRFEFTPLSATLELVGAFAAGWAFDFGRHPGAALVYTASTDFVFNGAAARFEAPPAHVLDAGGTAREVFGVTFDGLGNLYVVDTITEMLSVYAPDFSPLFTFGTPLGGTTAEFHEPYGVAYWPDAGGTSGRLFVADALNNRIEAFRPNLDTLTLDHLFTIEGFTIELFDSAQPYALAVDPATGRLAVSDSSGIANRSWILQTRNLVAFDLEVRAADGTPVDTVCSGAAYQVDFSLTVPDGWPPLTGVQPELIVGGVTQPAADGPVNLLTGQVYHYRYSLTAPVDIGDHIVVAGGTSLDTSDVLARKGLVAVSTCSPTNTPPTVTATGGPRQVAGWTPAFYDPIFQVSLVAADDTRVTDIEYEVLGANDIGFKVVRVANPIESNAQTVTIELPVFGESTIKFRARDNDFEWSAIQEQVVNLVLVENRHDFEGAVIGPFTVGPAAASGIIYGAAPLPAGIAFNPVTAEFSGTLTHDAAGTYTVVVTETSAVDPANVSAFSFQWTVTNVNVAPVAVADVVSGNEDTPLVAAAPGVLSNDTDPEGSPLTAILVDGPAHGTLSFNINGSYGYSPFANFSGTDSFVYRAFDGVNGSVPVVVTITVNPVNDAPSFVAGGSQSALEDAGPIANAWATAMTAGPADEAAQTLLFIASNSNPGLFSVQPAISAAGALTYQPAANASGSAIVTVRLRDNGGTANGGVDTSDPQTFMITVAPVDDPPVAQNDSYSFAGGLLNVPAPGVLANDIDVDSAVLIASLVAGPSSGVVQLSANGSFTFTPPAGFDGTVTFTYRVTDGVSNSVAIVSVTVTSNQPPICTAASTSADLWPPNHKQVYVTVGGVVDPEGSVTTVQFTSILQDEPTDSDGQGSTRQDGGIEDSGATAWVRSERSGTNTMPGDGRVYLIGFTATDAAGLSCTGTVRVDVPPDDRGTAAVLSPGRWNSITGQRVQ